MYVKFDYTEDDLVDATERFLSRSKSVRSARVRGVFYSALLSGLFVFALFFFVYGGADRAAVAGVLGALLGAVIHLADYRRSFRKRLHKIVRENHGEFGKDVCEVELTPVGVHVRQFKMQITYEWEAVEGIEETPDSIIIRAHKCGGVVVRGSAFRDADERRRFWETAGGYFELSRAGTASGGRGAGEVSGVLKEG